MAGLHHKPRRRDPVATIIQGWAALVKSSTWVVRSYGFLGERIWSLFCKCCVVEWHLDILVSLRESIPVLQVHSPFQRWFLCTYEHLRAPTNSMQKTPFPSGPDIRKTSRQCSAATTVNDCKWQWQKGGKQLDIKEPASSTRSSEASASWPNHLSSKIIIALWHDGWWAGDWLLQTADALNCHVTNALYLLVTETALAIFTEAVEVQGLGWRQVDQSQPQRNLEGPKLWTYFDKKSQSNTIELNSRYLLEKTCRGHLIHHTIWSCSLSISTIYLTCSIYTHQKIVRHENFLDLSRKWCACACVR